MRIYERQKTREPSKEQLLDKNFKTYDGESAEETKTNDGIL